MTMTRTSASAELMITSAVTGRNGGSGFSTGGPGG